MNIKMIKVRAAAKSTDNYQDECIRVAFEEGAKAQRQRCSEDMPQEWIKNIIKETPIAKLEN